MADEIKNEVVQNVEQDYAKTIVELTNKLKNSVSVDEYKKLAAENKQLIEGYKDNSFRAVEEQREPYTREDVQKFAKQLQGKNLSNRDYVKATLNYRQAVLDTEGEDVFVTKQRKVEYNKEGKPYLTDECIATPEDYKQAEETAKAFQELLDNSKTRAEFNELFRRALK